MGKIIMIAAHDENRGIGKDNQLPWGKIPEDMRHFKKTTMGHVVIMGRRTFESFGSKKLPGRNNIVISRTMDTENSGVFVEYDIENILHMLKTEVEKSFIIGGGKIYEPFLPYADEAILTEIKGTYDCDTYFPELPESEWEVTKEVQGEKIVIKYYSRKRG